MKEIVEVGVQVRLEDVHVEGVYEALQVVCQPEDPCVAGSLWVGESVDRWVSEWMTR